jgi:hypothetical protein
MNAIFTVAGWMVIHGVWWFGVTRPQTTASRVSPIELLMIHQTLRMATVLRRNNQQAFVSFGG